MKRALQFLVAARQAGDFDDAAALVYREALADVDPACLEEACKRLAKQPREDYKPAMPDVGTIRALAEVVGRERQEAARRAKLLPLPPQRDDEPTFHCLDCLDQPDGWVPFWCPGEGPGRTQADAKPERSARLPIARCGRTQSHGHHEWAGRCHCWQTNPVANARRDREAIRRAKPERRSA